MENNDTEQSAQKEIKQVKPEENLTSSISSRKGAIFQRLRDMGIKVTDITKEMEGKTYITTVHRPTSTENVDEINKEEGRES